MIKRTLVAVASFLTFAGFGVTYATGAEATTEGWCRSIQCAPMSTEASCIQQGQGCSVTNAFCQPWKWGC